MKTINYYYLTLDIETSTTKEYDVKHKKEMPVDTWLSYGVSLLVDVTGKILKKCRFRTWGELHQFFDNINSCIMGDRIICFVHNLAYEFDFLMKNLSPVEKMCCNSSHSVIFCKLKDFDIEFRCTYQLSRCSLKKLGEIYGLPKLESDYRTIYPSDDVTSEEWVYCERDNEILIPYITDLLTAYQYLSNIPYTSTGMVRYDLKQLINKYGGGVWQNYPPIDCYDAMSKAFRGGLTMSNPRFTGVEIHHKVICKDETSKYPGVMLAEVFPQKIEKKEIFTDADIKNTPYYIARVELTNIYSKYEWGVIASSTVEQISILNSTIFNGKVINADFVDMYLTNTDLEYIAEVYHIGNIKFTEFYPCTEVKTLPHPFIDLIFMYARRKSELKEAIKKAKENGGDTTELEREYNMSAKPKLNSIYGMSVQKLVSTSYYIDDYMIWHEKDSEYTGKGKKLNRNFLFGIWVTAYARRDLIFNIIKNCPVNFVYCDTDSIKYLDIGTKFVDINKKIPTELLQFDFVADFNRFDDDGEYKAMITYGAKKYCYIDSNNNFKFTVAGLPKKTDGVTWDTFRPGKTFVGCKLAKRYIYNGIASDFEVDNEIFMERQEIKSSNGGVALFATDYTLDMTERDKIYIRQNKKTWDELDKKQKFDIKRLDL